MSDPTDFPEVQPKALHGLAVDNSLLAGSIVAAAPLIGQLCIGNNAGTPLVTISLDTGQITYGPDYDPDEAARLFWDAITTQFSSPDRYFGPGLNARIDQHLREGEAAEKQVQRLDRMAEAWKANLPETIRTAAAADAVHVVTRPNGERP